MGLYSGDAYDNTITGTASPDTISGYGGADVLRGAGGPDAIAGGDGNDTIVGDDGADTLFGGAGDDLLAGAYPSDVSLDWVYGDAGDDSILFDVGDRVYGGLGDDLFEISPTATAAVTLIDGGDGFDIVNLMAFTGQTVIALDQFALGTIEIDHAEFVLLGDGGVNLYGGGADDAVIGGLGADYIHGGAGNDLLAGLDGNDYLEGGDGDDVLDGGRGDDQLYGGAGIDLIDYSAAPGAVRIDLSVTTAQDTGYGRDSISGVEQIFATVYADTLQGGTAAESLTASSGDDVVSGRGGDDTLTGDDGRDTLDGGVGADSLSGGLGADTFLFLRGADGNDVIADFQSGVDKIDISGLAATAVTVSTGPSPGSEFLHVTSASGEIVITVTGPLDLASDVIGAPGDTVVGGTAGESLSGGSFNDTITGGGGGDRLTGGGGLDTFRYTAASDSTASAYDLITDFASGSDKIDLSAVSPTSVDVVGLGDAYFVFVGTPTGPMQIAVQGQAPQPGDFVTGNPALGFGVVGGASNETFTGAGGLDALNGGGGDDVLIGGAHGDVLTGGAGADVFKYLAATDSTPQSGDTITDFQTGVDKIDLSAVSPVNVNVIYAAGASFLFIPAGGITMQIGVTGQVSAGDLITAPGLGINVLGDSVAETLTGSANLDALNGGGGNDVVIGGGHGDVLTGGAGADVFRYAAASDSTAASYDIITDFQTGTDTLDLSAVGLQGVSIIQQSGASFLFATTAQGAMQIAATGAVNGSDITGLTQGVAVSVGDAATHGLVGSGFADTLSGGSAADVLIGGGGGDLLIGGGGADTFKYLAYADSPLGSPDTIGDFRHGVDHIDISALHTAGSTFGLAVSGADTQVFIDQGGNGTNDALIILQNTTSVTTADFIW